MSTSAAAQEQPPGAQRRIVLHHQGAFGVGAVPPYRCSAGERQGIGADLGQAAGLPAGILKPLGDRDVAASSL